MSRKVFFSFHFKRDAWRAGQVRNSNLLADEDKYGIIDSVDWEKIEREGEEAVKRWIDGQLKNTSVTVVLIGAKTAERDWVDYEIRKSWERGNALVGLRIHNVKDQDGKTDSPGPNPLDEIRLTNGAALSSICKTYDWVSDDGRKNLGQWIEEAHRARTAHKGETKLSETEKSISSPSKPAYGSGPTVITNPARPWAH